MQGNDRVHRRTSASGPVVAIQPAAEASGPANCADAPGTTGTPIADQARRTTGPTGYPRRRFGIASPTVAIQDPTGLTIRAGRCSVRAVADQRAPRQCQEGRIDNVEQILLCRLRRIGR